MDEPQIVEQLRAACARRAGLADVTNAVRLVNGWGDALDGLVLEQYGSHFVAQVFDERWLSEQEFLAKFLAETFQAQYFIVKDRTQSASAKPEAIRTSVMIDKAPSKTIVVENGLKFVVDLNDTLNSGLFLDMRANRKLVTQKAAGRRVLNTFAYSCSFGVYARAQGAVAVTNVDVSKKILERGQENYALNQLTAAGNEFIRADAVQYLERAVKKDNRFDMIILDPPSFARHDGEIFSVKKDMAHLVDLAVKVLDPGGLLFVATNYSEMGTDHLEALVADAAGKRKLKGITPCGQDVDFPTNGFMPESYLAAVLVEL
jgi:23S rRNA (cytosine1962-C5)-methyltransferase